MATDSYNVQNVSATPATFNLLGGKYAVTAEATWGGGSAKLQIQSPKLGPAATFISVNSSTDFAANGFFVLDLPAGTYQITIATATAVYLSIVGLPEAADAVKNLQNAIHRGSAAAWAA